MNRENKQSSRMFSFITGTENPLGGKCPGACSYCWAQSKKGLATKRKMEKYKGSPRLYHEYFCKKFKEGEFVFICDMRDLLSPDVPSPMIEKILRWEEKNPDAWFLNLTKYPERYLDFFHKIPKNAVIGATIESDLDHHIYSKATPQSSRLKYMKAVRERFPDHRLLVCIEPILRFRREPFVRSLRDISPWKVPVGYDNYNNGLDEPSLAETEVLIERLKEFTEVELKTLRPAWWEK